MKNKRWIWIGEFLLGAQFAAVGGTPEHSGQPNIVLILSDDHGFADVSCYGGTQIPTPNMDSIAANGIRFSEGYVSAPQCGPSRAGLMSGRYQNKFGYEYNTLDTHERRGFGLPLSEKTMADCLKDLGYKTAAFGKWHLGAVEKLHPLNRGFDYFYGFLHGANPYVPDEKTGYVPNIVRNREPAHETDYLTFGLAREICSFVENNKQHPFFVYAAFNAPHTPLTAPKDYLMKFKQLAHIKSPPPHETATGRRQVYAAMVGALDDAVGGILQQLKKSGVYENTLVCFLSDNGAVEIYGGLNDPLRGKKGDLYEGGIHVPFMMQWPARLKGGQVYTNPVISLDLLPTFVAAAGGIPAEEKEGLDGENLLPWLEGGKSGVPHETLYWRFLFKVNDEEPNYYTITEGKTVYALLEPPWKLICNKDRGGMQLFNLSDDPGEATNRISDFPEVAQRLQKKYERWNSTLAEPAWPEN
jgi:arylsulfatase A-like enzyme